ncbi:hypothetical protein TraAM80_09329, partial [Trypanosoma rangeli]
HTVNWWVAFPKQQARRAWHRPSHRLSRNVRAKSSAGSSVGAPSCSSTPRAYSQCPSCCSAFVRHGFFTDGSAPTTRHIGRCVLHSAPQEGLNVAAEWANKRFVRANIGLHEALSRWYRGAPRSLWNAFPPFWVPCYRAAGA